MSKRTSMLPASAQGPKPPTKLSSSLTISDTAVLTGRHPIVLSSESVVHPRCRLESLTGPLVVGKRCVIHERTHVGAPPASGVEGGVELKDYVTIEAAAVVEAGGTVVEEGSVVGVGVRVGAGARIGKNCTITPRSVILPGEEIPDFTVVYSNGLRRLDKRDLGDMRLRAQVRQVNVLRGLIPTNLVKHQ